MSQTVNGTANSRITVMRLGRLPGSDRKLTRCPSTWVLSGIVELQHPGAFLLLEGEIEIALRHGDPQLVRTALVKQLEDGLLDRPMVDVDLLDRRDGIETPEIGRASCRERKCKHVRISGVGGSLKKKKKTKKK